jgi:hypothetical protein
VFWCRGSSSGTGRSSTNEVAALGVHMTPRPLRKRHPSNSERGQTFGLYVARADVLPQTGPFWGRGGAGGVASTPHPGPSHPLSRRGCHLATKAPGLLRRGCSSSKSIQSPISGTRRSSWRTRHGSSAGSVPDGSRWTRSTPDVEQGVPLGARIYGRFAGSARDSVSLIDLDNHQRATCPRGVAVALEGRPAPGASRRPPLPPAS